MDATLQQKYREFSLSGRVPKLAFVPFSMLVDSTDPVVNSCRPAISVGTALRLGWTGTTVILWDGPLLLTESWLSAELTEPVQLPAVTLPADNGYELLRRLQEFSLLHTLLAIGRQLSR